MIKQEHVFFESDDSQLFGAFFNPADNKNQSIGYLICSPFTEEKKSSQRMMVDMARQLTEAGYPSFLFDYYACGDSQGNFKDASISKWIKNTRDALCFFHKRSSLKEIRIIGIRLGCYIALSAISGLENVSMNIFIEPVLDPEPYFKNSLRQKLMKELITDGKTTSSRSELINQLAKENISIDFDGYEISSFFYKDLLKQKEQITSLKLQKIDTLLIHITPTGRISKKFQKIIEPSYTNKKLCFKKIQLNPFWERIDNPVYQPVIDEILNVSLYEEHGNEVTAPL